MDLDGISIDDLKRLFPDASEDSLAAALATNDYSAITKDATLSFYSLKKHFPPYFDDDDLAIKLLDGGWKMGIVRIYPPEEKHCLSVDYTSKFFGKESVAKFLDIITYKMSGILTRKAEIVREGFFEGDRSDTAFREVLNVNSKFGQIQDLLASFHAAYHSPAPPTEPKPLVPINDPVPTDVQKKRKYKKGDLTQKQAAALCGVSVRLFQMWEKGERTPDNFPGRFDAIAFRAWAESYLSQERLREAVSNKNRAISMDPADIERREDKGDSWD